jgi:hypothetical protein
VISKIELQPWLLAIVMACPGRLACGLFHPDGYRGINRVRARLGDGDHWYEYPPFLFSNKSAAFCGCAGKHWTGSGWLALLPAECHIGGPARGDGAARRVRRP